MEKINHTEISMNDYQQIESNIDSMTKEEQLIEAHKKLIGKSCKCDYYEIKDCGVEFIKHLLSRDWGRTIVYHYSIGAKNFITSKYLSDYFKNSIKELLSDQDFNEEVLNSLNSDKIINDMSEEEILQIYSAIKDFYNQSSQIEKDNVASYFMSFLYKLDGQGITSFIKNNVDNRDLASHILLTSGLNDRASFYSGRGVEYGDLNQNNLVAIFNKLLKLDIEYAINFAQMVIKMKSLRATEFINSFKDLATNDFKLKTQNIDDSNVSLDGVYGQARNFIGLISIMNIEDNQDYQIRASEQIKNNFMSMIMPTLQSIDPNFDKFLTSPLFNAWRPIKTCYSFKR